MTIVKQPSADVAWYAPSAEDMAGQMGLNPDHGLDAAGFQRRPEDYGPNELPTEPPSAWAVTRGQLANPMNITLIVCAAGGRPGQRLSVAGAEA